MSDPYSLTDTSLTSTPTPGAAPDRRPEDPRGPASADLRRAGLWVLLVLSAVANSVTSFLGVHLAISAGFGVATLASIVALVVTRHRGVSS